jgi:hypothetical protein
VEYQYSARTGSVNSIWNKEELPEECKQLISVPIYKKGDKRLQ